MFDHYSAQFPSNSNLFTFLQLQSISMNINKNIEQVCCVEIPNLMVLCKNYFAYLI